MEVLTVANSNGISHPMSPEKLAASWSEKIRREVRLRCTCPAPASKHQTLRNQQPTPGATGHLKLRNIIKGLRRGIGPLPAQRGEKENGERYGFVFNQ